MRLVRETVGIELGPAKRTMVQARLGKRLRALGIGIGEYLARVEADPGERVMLIDLLATNHTSWWREPAHFEDFQQRVLRPLAAETAPRLRVWCAAASSGEEPYSIALCVERALGAHPRGDAAILATDISTKALALARAGRYGEASIAALGRAERALACQRERRHDKPWVVRDELRRLVHFARLNLMLEWPMRGPFDVIFCRNVMIYFDKPRQARLIKRLAGLLRRGGTLYVGHSESLAGLDHPLRPLGASVYLAP
jgi:chemotaxis protein methyltransferase CheR